MIFNDENPRDDSGEVYQRIEKVTLAIVAGAAYGRRVSKVIGSDHNRWTRYHKAIGIVNDEARSRLLAALEGTESADIELLQSLNFGKDNAETLHGRFTDEECIALLLTAHTSNPVAPYEIHINDDEREQALEGFARDIGAPRSFSELVISCSRRALKCHAQGVNLSKVALLVAGVAIIAMAPALVALVAPAGLAGGAAIVAGLSALGPGGMLGGLAIVGGVGAGGGGLAAGALTLTSGSRETVQSNVIFLHTMALIDQSRRPWKQEGPDTVALLQAMRKQLVREISTHESLDDKGSRTLKDLKSKLNDIDKSLSCLLKDGLGSAEAITEGKGKH